MGILLCADCCLELLLLPVENCERTLIENEVVIKEVVVRVVHGVVRCASLNRERWQRKKRGKHGMKTQVRDRPAQARVPPPRRVFVTS